MLAQYNNSLLCSVTNWAANRVQNVAQAYINTTAPLYYAPDPRLPAGLLSYASSWKTWVYDSGVSGATIIQSVSGSAGVLGRSSGLIFDYINGRVLVPSGMGTKMVLTGSFAISEINVGLTNETEEQLLTESSKFFLNPRYGGTITGNVGIPPYAICTPAVFVNTIHDDHSAFEFGGLDDCTSTISLICLVESPFQLQVMMSLMRDAKYQYIPLMPVTADPITQWGDTYSGFNYQGIINQYGNPGQLIYIEQVKTSRVPDRIKLNPMLYMGIVSMDVSYIRTTQ